MSTRTKTAEARSSVASFETNDAGDEHASSGLGAARVTVNKAYKMYVNGAFIRSESGRYLQVASGVAAGLGADPAVINVPWGSRKDIRDAVLAAKGAESKWAGKTAYNRGQILYRLAEMTEARGAELREVLERSGLSAHEAGAEVEASVDRIVYYAGLADKLSALLASHNPVAGPHFGFTVPEPTGIVGVIAPAVPALLGFLSAVLPVIVSGNTAVVVVPASRENTEPAADPRVALVFGECLATCDLPAGVVNVLTGPAAELGPILAKHREVNALFAWSEDDKLSSELGVLAADSVKRVKLVRDRLAERVMLEGQGLGLVEPFLEHKSIWHPVGL